LLSDYKEGTAVKSAKVTL